ncbi:YggT family protein [Arachnia propionica]|uniref:YggT family protein n=1 Tax=Arachnia propionica TaxID=1750 RepID=A0A3P1T6J8_9ACTN|nr:YggT family protein [Arachnia propionica]MDO5083498.1 YggT family protein [Arachnia propionica]RRD04950.1 YggT family protein [Arachnia propionica]
MITLILVWILRIYLLVLLGRVILSWVPLLAPQWTPRGPVLVLVEGIYFLTDPPVKLLQRHIKPVRIGHVGLDLSVLLLFLLVQLLIWVVILLPL